MYERASSFPCVICGGGLQREMNDYEAQPSDGVMCRTGGNYGSTVFDPMNGEVIRFNICDACFVEAGNRGRLFISHERLPVTTDTPMTVNGKTIVRPTIVGSKAIERPFVEWYRGLADSDETEYLTIDEVLERYDNDKYGWNLKREHFEQMRDAITALED